MDPACTRRCASGSEEVPWTFRLAFTLALGNSGSSASSRTGSKPVRSALISALSRERFPLVRNVAVPKLSPVSRHAAPAADMLTSRGERRRTSCCRSVPPRSSITRWVRSDERVPLVARRVCDGLWASPTVKPTPASAPRRRAVNSSASMPAKSTARSSIPTSVPPGKSGSARLPVMVAVPMPMFSISKDFPWPLRVARCSPCRASSRACRENSPPSSMSRIRPMVPRSVL